MEYSQALWHVAQLPYKGQTTEGAEKHNFFQHQTYKPALHILANHAVSVNLQGLSRGGEQGLLYFLHTETEVQRAGAACPKRLRRLVPAPG